MPRHSLALALALLCGIAWTVSGPDILAQEEPTPATAPSTAAATATEASVLRTRGESGWRAYVWTLNRETLRAAVGDLEEARRLDGGDVTFAQVFLLAYGNLVLGHAETGERAAREVRRMAPSYPGLMLLDAFAATLRDDDGASLERLDRFVDVVESNDSEPEFRFLGRLHRGVQLFDMGENDRAIVDLEMALKVAEASDRKPPNEAILRLALAHQRVQQFGEAEKLVRGLLATDPGNPYLYYNLGLLFATQNDFTEARRWYLAAAERKRDYPDPHVKLAFLAWKDSASDPTQLRRMRAHLEAYTVLIGPQATDDLMADAQTGYGAYWFAIAEQRTVAGHEKLAADAYSRARAHCVQALRHNPECVRALNLLVKIGFQMGATDEEIAPFKERLDAIDAKDGSAPEAYRSTFC
jgi:tetratricopeptide (TPR) repeat protein